MAEEERLRFPHGHRPRLRVKEQDGDPTVEGVREIRVSNATLTDEGKGVVSIVTGAGGGGGAPTDADYLVGTANPDLSAEIVVGATPGGELGGTWGTPTVDATHSGSAHHTRKHNIDGTDDHTGLVATEDNFMGINASGLPVDSGSCADDFAAAVHAHTTYVLKSLFTAQTVIAATASATPAAVTMAEQTVVGRLTGGNIAAVSLGIADNNVVQIDQADAADNDYAKFTAAGLEGRSCTEVKQDLDLEDADINTLADAVADGLIAAAFTETSGPTALTLGSITNGQHLQRVNTEIVGSTLSGIYVAKSIVDTKGDLIVAEADNDVGVLAAGANGTVLTADDGEATGLKWAAAGGGVSEISLGTYPGGMSYTP